MLKYRTVFEVPDRRDDVVTVALSQLNAWLRHKKYAPDLIEAGREARIGPTTTGFLQELDGGDSSRTVRARIIESPRTGTWTSTLTVHVPGDLYRTPWVWLDVDGPDHIQPQPPRLARDLLEVFDDAHDGKARLRPAPEIIDRDGVDDLVAIVLDPARRRPVFVAGSDALMPLPRWQTLLTDLLSSTVGLASAFVLDAGATNLLAHRLGSTHAVHPGTMRTFFDRVDIDNPVDGLRHRILTTQRIVRGDSRTVARTLGERAREIAIVQPLPHALVRADQLLERQLNSLLLERETDVATPAVVADPGQGQQAPVQPPTGPALTTGLASEPHGDDVSRLGVTGPPDAPATRPDESVARTAEILTALQALIRAALGTDEPSPEAVQRLGVLVQRGRASDHQHARLAERLTALQERYDAARREIDALTSRLEDEQLETAAANDERAEQERLVRHLRALVAQTDRAGAAWEVPEADELPAPESFDDLLVRISDLPHVVLTMRKTDAIDELAQRDPVGTWVRKTWDVLLALDDYAACKADGTCERDVDGYLRHTPDGRRTFSDRRHARDESEDVRTNQRFRSARVLPVPVTIDPSGTVFMGAHFKIAQSGLISPRLHYFDATSVDGKVYVGYIGPHLPTKQTN